jgi:hypothetical protein
MLRVYARERESSVLNTTFCFEMRPLYSEAQAAVA